MKRIDLTGKRFGQLTVVEYSHSHLLPSGQKRVMWKTLCDCGNESIISSANIKKTISCGCLKREGLNKKPNGVASFNLKFNQYKAGASRRGFSFELTKDEFFELVRQPCFYCGAIDSTRSGFRSCNGYFYSNGIDRVDSNEGYILKNCVACCPTCNRMKLDMPQDLFYSHMRKILQHIQKV